MFYYGPVDWVDSRNDKLWNSGTESEPLKTEYDPCPEGWRVPTGAELKELSQNRSSWTSEDGLGGYWLSGASSYTEDVPQVFFSAAGYRFNGDGNGRNRGCIGTYWSSEPDYPSQASCILLRLRAFEIRHSARKYGSSVRCVQE